MAEGLWEVGALHGTGEAPSSEESQPQPAHASKDVEPPPASPVFTEERQEWEGPVYRATQLNVRFSGLCGPVD